MLETLVSHLPASLQDKAKATVAFAGVAATVIVALTPLLPEGWRDTATAVVGALTFLGVYGVPNKQPT